MNGMKFSHRSASLSSFDVYSRFLDMHDELQKSSKSLNSLINQSLRLVTNKEEPRFSFSAEYQQNMNSFDKISEEEDQQTQPLNNEKEQILENKIKIYESALRTLEEEKYEKDQEIQRLKNILEGKEPLQNNEQELKSSIRDELKIMDEHLAFLDERKEMQNIIKEQELQIKKQKEMLNNQQLEISRLKHINQYLHKSIDKQMMK